jgi:hypothetical protein
MLFALPLVGYLTFWTAKATVCPIPSLDAARDSSGGFSCHKRITAKLTCAKEVAFQMLEHQVEHYDRF